MSENKQKLSVFQGVGMLVSALLGSGVFIIPAIAAQVAGSWSLLAWALMGSLIIPIVFTFAQLGKRFPHAGGTAYFVQQAFGENSAKLVSWLFIWVVALGAPVIAMTAANFLHNALYTLPAFTALGDIRLYLAIAILVLLLLINSLGLKTAALIQSLLSVAVVATLLFSSLDSQLNHTAQLPDTAFNLADIAYSATFILWCFLGIEAITHIANDFKKPERDFPLTIFIGIAITLVVYALISVSLLRMGFYGDEQKNLNSVVHLVANSLGQQGYLIVNLIGFCTCFISVSLYFVGCSRLLQSMAEQYQVPKLFARLNRFGVAYWGLSFAIVLCLAVLLISEHLHIEIDRLIAFANGLFIAIYFAAGIAGVRLLADNKKWVAKIASITCLLLFFALGKEMLFALFLVVVIGGYYAVSHYWYNRT